MAMRKTQFAIGEWYHCYSRGVDKRIVFKDRRDYHRFLEQLYLANNEESFHRDDLGIRDFEKILKIKRKGALVAIGAFCLMPNHFHLVLKEIVDGGISTFMQKLGTAYTMYFNNRYERSGNLFVKPFRSRYVDTDRYFQHLINYVHCNPAELYEPRWKTGSVKNFNVLLEKLVEYPYSSLVAYEYSQSSTRVILDEEVFDIARTTPAREMLQEAREYYLRYSELLY